MKKLFLVIIVTMFLLASCSNTYCPKNEAITSIDEMMNLSEEWDDAMAVANSTSRIGLAGPIGNLQAIKREADRLEVPPCLEWTQTRLIKMMEHGINGFLAFASDEPESTVVSHFNKYSIEMHNFVDALAEVNQCLPNCKEP
jgi:hypothetical protein